MTAIASFALFLALGLTASYEDWVSRKIRNRLILRGLAGAGLALAWLALNSLLGWRHARFLGLGEFYLPGSFYRKVFVHGALSFAAAFSLWRMSVWPAGDAKLFTLFALLAPLIDPNLPGFPGLLFLLLLINVFVPAGVVFGAETAARAVAGAPALARLDWAKWLKAKREMLAIRLAETRPYRVQYAALGVNLFAVFFGLQYAQARFLGGVREPFRSLAIFFLMFVFWPPLAAALRRRAVGAAALVGLLAWSVTGAFLGWDIGGRLARAVGMTLSFSMFLSVSRFVFAWLIERDSLRALSAERLEAGVVLSDATWERLTAEKDLAGKIGPRLVDGLSAEDADALRAWLAGKGTSDYSVYQTIPFAVWIFFGSLLTVSGGPSAVVLLGRALRRLAP